ncbi:nuclear transport factor 2 family protein [Mesorhizobium jarvisii]|uniref:nuclear transport factor 2 family protein n=1 Tax=Mesorhizobium jarvisii TaxID=1777867 RepID=UPI001CB7A7B9|nr:MULTISPECIES: nuclear transport factor 2 family protein [Mesorhizobium]
MAVDPRIVELELALLKAPTRSDPRFLDAVLDDSMIEFGKSGFEYDKRSILAALTDSRNSQRPTIIWR